jgi:hypothetical protein
MDVVMSTPPSSPNPTPQEPDQPRYGQNPPAYGQNPPAYGQNPPAYGQNPPAYGQNPPAYGQQQPPYGYQSAQPSGYAYPSQAALPGADRGPAPRNVVIAYWLLIAAGALNLLDSILRSSDPTAGIPPEQLEQLEGSGVTAESLTGVLTATVIVVALVSAAIYILLAFMIRKGKNWARITATVLAVLSLFGILAGGLHALVVLLGVAAVVLCYLKPSNEYFAPRPARY